MATFLPKINSNSDVLGKDDDNSLLKGGRSYQLGDSQVPHHLPPPGKLKPHVDRIAGEMETWPANSNLMSSSQVKPTFLQKLEAYLSRELRILGCSVVTPSEKRLQAFREVFEYLIDDFRTYKPLLSAIKQEYESMLIAQKETIRSLEPLKAMLVNVNDQCEQKVLNLKQDDKKDLALAKKKNTELEDVILTLKEEIISLKQQVKKCQGEVEDVYKKYRDESDSKKLLIQSMNDLKYQQEDSSKKATSGGNEEGGEEEDCVFLRIALKKAREDFDKKNVKLAEVMADYGDVVPRRDFEKMEVQFASTKEEFESLQNDYNVLRMEHASLIDVHNKVVEQRDSFASDCERMRVSATPRPDWDKCALYIEGGQERWLEISSECSTNDKVDILLAEMTGQDIEAIRSGVGGIMDFFEPKGITENIPGYLQSSEKVRNRRLAKHDILVMIKDIWQQKIKEEGNAPFSEHSLMQNYLYKYLKQCFSVENMVIEWGYNVHDAVMRYSAESNVSIFGGILNGELDEDIYYDNLIQLEGLHRVLAMRDSDDNGGLNKEDFQNCISSYFPYISSENLMNILKSAEEELGSPDSSLVMYKELFTEDDGGNTGPFLNLIQQLSRQDKEKYLKEIETYLENNNEISRDDLSDALLTINPKINQELTNTYVDLGFRANADEKIDLPSLIKNLSRSCIKRI